MCVLQEDMETGLGFDESLAERLVLGETVSVFLDHFTPASEV